jgi:hypothetical protein
MLVGAKEQGNRPCVSSGTRGTSPPKIKRSSSTSKGILRHSPWDALFVLLALTQGALLIAMPSIWLIALGLWWNANTVSHNFIHLPFFQSRRANIFFSGYLSLLMGIPQTLWRDRHLSHHADAAWRVRLSRALVIETTLVLGWWVILLFSAPAFFLKVYLPGYALGLGLCHLQGHYEHSRGTTSHYGRLYNFLFFNDGYHVEHHARPAMHWRRLSGLKGNSPNRSCWPAVLRWLERFSLESLERWVLGSRFLQEFVLRKHKRAFKKILPQLPAIGTVAIVGGGLFPRTAIILKDLLPQARLIIVDANAENIRDARAFLNGDVEWSQRFYDPEAPDQLLQGIDLLIIPLSFQGDRARFYRYPPCPNVLIHDWLWRRHQKGVMISLPLMKRLNLVRQP